MEWRIHFLLNIDHIISVAKYINNRLTVEHHVYLMDHDRQQEQTQLETAISRSIFQTSTILYFSSFFFFFLSQLRERGLLSKTDARAAQFRSFLWNLFFWPTRKVIMESHIFMCSHSNKKREDGGPWSGVYIGQPTKSTLNCIEKIPKDPEINSQLFPST